MRVNAAAGEERTRLVISNRYEFDTRTTCSELCVRAIMFVGGVVGMAFTAQYIHTHELTSGNPHDTGNVIGLVVSLFFIVFSLIPNRAFKNFDKCCCQGTESYGV